MAHLSVRSLTIHTGLLAGLLAGLLVLGGCGIADGWLWSSEPPRAETVARKRPAAVEPPATPARPGSLLANLFGTAPDDDEKAIDARALSRAKSASLVMPLGLPKTGSGGSPPRLNVLYVINGRIRAYGSAVIVRGTVDDDDGEVVEVTVNGKPAILKDRSFSRRLPVTIGETEVVVRAEDEDGNFTTTRFAVVRSHPGQRLAVQRPATQELSNPEYRYIASAIPAAPRLEDLREPGVYMILLAGTPSAHFVRMPSLVQCREAAEYTENAACAFHRGRD